MLGDGEQPAVPRPRTSTPTRRRSAQHFWSAARELAGRRRRPPTRTRSATATSATGGRLCKDRRRDDDHLSLVADLHRGAGPASSRTAASTRSASSPRSPQDATVAAAHARDARRRCARRPTCRSAAAALDAPAATSCSSPSTTAASRACPSRRRATCSSTSRATRTGATTASSTCSAPSTATRTASGATGRCGRTTRAEEKAALRAVDGLDHRAARRATPTCTSSTSTPTSRPRSSGSSRATRTREHEVDELLRRKVLRRPLRHRAARRSAPASRATASRRSSRSSASSATPSCEARSARCAAGRPGRTTATRTHLDAHRRLQRGRLRRDARALLDWLLERAARGRGAVRHRARRARSPSRPSRSSDQARATTSTRLEALRPRLTGRPPRRRVATDDRRAARRPHDVRPARLPPPRGQARVVGVLRAARASRRQQLRDEDTEAIGDLELVAGSTSRGQRSHVAGRCASPSRSTSSAPGDGWTTRAPSAASTIARARRGRRASSGVTRAQDARRRARRARSSRAARTRTDAQVDALVPLRRSRRRRGPRAVRPARRRHRPAAAPRRRGSRPGTPPLADGPVDLDAPARRRSRGARPLARSSSRARPAPARPRPARRLAVDLMRARPARRRRRDVAQGDQQPAGGDRRGGRRGAASTSAAGRSASEPEDAVRQRPDRRRSTTPRPPTDDGPIRSSAATAWHWAREDERDAVDVLFVDEAGQVSLADAIAVSQGARSVVLLGDPQQLAHVSQGTHPRGSRRLGPRAPARRPRHRAAGPRRLPRHARGACTPTSAASSRDTMYDGAPALDRRAASASASTRRA